MANVKMAALLTVTTILFSIGSTAQASVSAYLPIAESFKISISIGPTPSGALGGEESCAVCTNAK